MVHIPRQILQKYDRPGPRYTSYPPATHFHSRVGPAEYSARLGALRAGDPLSLYIHVPFCEERCTYCGCYSIRTPHRSIARKYLDHSIEELALVRRRLASPARLSSIHLGGGTPTYLRPEELTELLLRVREDFELEEDVEISVEVDPRVTTERHLEVLREARTNRISLGIQDTSAEVQAAIGRFQSRETSVGFFGLCRKAGFQSINVDLVYGLPLQTPERFRGTLKDVISLHPERLAIFGYAHVPWIRPQQKRIDPKALPGAEARLELCLMAHDELTAAGYHHIGMDHFALPEDELTHAQREGRLGRNFMGYTPRRDSKIIGIGVSSIGDLGDGYFQNAKKLSAYFDALGRGEFPLERGFVSSQDDIVRRHVIQEILCNLKLRYEAFARRFRTPFQEYFAREMDDLKDLERDGLIRLEAEGIDVTPVGTFLLRNIAMPFDRYLREAPPARATYSRTV